MLLRLSLKWQCLCFTGGLCDGAPFNIIWSWGGTIKTSPEESKPQVIRRITSIFIPVDIGPWLQILSQPDPTNQQWLHLSMDLHVRPCLINPWNWHWRNFKIHGTLPFHKIFFIVEKGSFDYYYILHTKNRSLKSSLRNLKWFFWKSPFGMFIFYDLSWWFDNDEL